MPQRLKPDRIDSGTASRDRLGAYGAELDRILSIGGDGINTKAKPASVNRFKPAVVHVGPFKLEKGQTARHRLQLDNYVGSVRVMAVLSAPPTAGGTGAYGNAEKTCPVRKPLMIMPTLPRVLGPGETLRLPVDVFAMEKSVQNATITVREKSGLVSVGGTERILRGVPAFGEAPARQLAADCWNSPG